MKKNLQSVTASLTDLAGTMPTQKPLSVVVPRPAAASEPLVQFSFSMRRSLRRELDRLAADSDVTMRAFVLNALKEKGLSVIDEDLRDLRKQLTITRPGR